MWIKIIKVNEVGDGYGICESDFDRNIKRYAIRQLQRVLQLHTMDILLLLIFFRHSKVEFLTTAEAFGKTTFSRPASKKILFPGRRAEKLYYPNRINILIPTRCVGISITFRLIFYILSNTIQLVQVGISIPCCILIRHCSLPNPYGQ